MCSWQTGDLFVFFMQTVWAVSFLLDQTRTDERREQKKGNTVLCVWNRSFHLGSDMTGTSSHLAHRKIDPYTLLSIANLLLPYASQPCFSSEDHRQPCALSKASFFGFLLVHVLFISSAQVYNDISTGGVFEEGGLDRSHIFLTIHDAVLFALANIKEVVHPPILEEVNLLPSHSPAHGTVLLGLHIASAERKNNNSILHLM